MEEIIQLITLEQREAAQESPQRSKKRPSFRMRAGGATPLGKQIVEPTDNNSKDLSDDVTTSTETNNESFSSLLSCNVDDDSPEESKAADSDSSSAASKEGRSSSTTGSRRVSFNEVQVREYEQVLSYNPACSEGAAVEIGWHYNNEEHRSVDEFELERPPPLSKELLQLSRSEREAILARQGYTAFDLAASEREIRVIQLNRMKTLRKLIKEEQKQERKLNKKLRGFPFFRKRRQRAEGHQVVES